MGDPIAIHVNQGLFYAARKYKINSGVALVMTELFPASHENTLTLHSVGR
jgi:hypothetical protein